MKKHQLQSCQNGCYIGRKAQEGRWTTFLAPRYPVLWGAGAAQWIRSAWQYYPTGDPKQAKSMYLKTQWKSSAPKALCSPMNSPGNAASPKLLTIWYRVEKFDIDGFESEKPFKRTWLYKWSFRNTESKWFHLYFSFAIFGRTLYDKTYVQLRMSKCAFRKYWNPKL